MVKLKRDAEKAENDLAEIPEAYTGLLATLDSAREEYLQFLLDLELKSVIERMRLLRPEFKKSDSVKPPLFSKNGKHHCNGKSNVEPKNKIQYEN